jgi:hypothetical protein
MASRELKFEVQHNVVEYLVGLLTLNCFTATRLCTKAQGCRFGYPGLPENGQFNRNAVASAAATRSGLMMVLAYPRVEATLGFETKPLRGTRPRVLFMRASLHKLVEGRTEDELGILNTARWLGKRL